MHVCSPGVGTDNPMVSISFHSHNYSVNYLVKLVLCCKLSPLNGVVTVFPLKHIDDPI